MKTFLYDPLPIPLPLLAPADPPAGDPPAGDPPAGDPPAGDAPKDPPAGDAPKDPPSGKTALDGDGDDDAELPGAADWPADWRERLAGGDEKKLAELKRVTDPTMLGKRFFDSLDAARKKGGGAAVDLNAAPPEDAEELKTWRAARGVPDEATGYEIPKEITEMVTDEDKPLVSGFFEKAHATGMPKRAAEWAVQQYFELRDQALAHESEEDKNAKAETTAELKQLWGPEYKKRTDHVKNFVADLGNQAGTPDWFAARLPDGRMLGNVPGFTKLMAELAVRLEGDEVFAGETNSSQTKSRKEELLNIMKTDIRRWNSSPDLRSELFKINEAEARRNGSSE